MGGEIPNASREIAWIESSSTSRREGEVYLGAISLGGECGQGRHRLKIREMLGCGTPQSWLIMMR